MENRACEQEVTVTRMHYRAGDPKERLAGHKLPILSKCSHERPLLWILSVPGQIMLALPRCCGSSRDQAGYHHKEPLPSHGIVRIAQGLVHVGKGTIGIDPILNKPAAAGLLATLTTFTDAKACTSSNVIFDDDSLMSSHRPQVRARHCPSWHCKFYV